MSDRYDNNQLMQTVELALDGCSDPRDPAENRRSGQPAQVTSRASVAGGCIGNAEVFTFDNNQRVFVKSSREHPGLFAAESAGLAAIRQSNSIKVPDEFGSGQTESGIGYLVLEWIETGSATAEFESKLGRAVGTLHRQSQNPRFGFETDNFLGSSRQPNSWSTDWVEFWAVNRLGFQLELCNRLGHATTDFNRMCHRLNNRLPSLIATDEPASLIHGDLWSGNYLCGPKGIPVLIDPAVYYGSRESEFGMTTLFGGLGTRFYDAYQEIWPMPDGWQERVEIYRLYHLMNHLNLFGASYFSSCIEILKRFG